MQINEKETTYESGVIDNLFKIGDKLVALRDNKPDNFNKAINYIVSELHAYNSVTKKERKKNESTKRKNMYRSDI